MTSGVHTSHWTALSKKVVDRTPGYVFAGHHLYHSGVVYSRWLGYNALAPMVPFGALEA